jgi:hypothetical protein
MPPPRTPQNKPYLGHHPRAGTIHGELVTRAPAYVPSTQPCPPERTLVLEFRSEDDRDAMQTWLDQLWDTKREGCEFCG